MIGVPGATKSTDSTDDAGDDNGETAGAKIIRDAYSDAGPNLLTGSPRIPFTPLGDVKAMTGDPGTMESRDDAGDAGGEGYNNLRIASALGDTLATSPSTRIPFTPLGDSKIIIGDAADAADATESTESTESTDDAGDDAPETAGATITGGTPLYAAGPNTAPLGESKIIIGADAGIATAPGAGAADADATTLLDLNPGGAGKNTGSGAGPPFAPGDLILTIILGFALGLPSDEEDHLLLGDTLRTTGADAADEADDTKDAAGDKDAATDAGNEARDIEGEEALDDELAGITNNPGPRRPLRDEELPSFLTDFFFLENNLPTHAPKPFLGDAGAIALIPLRDDADADELLRLANETAGDAADELLRLINPGPLTPGALAIPGPARIPLTLAPILLIIPGRTGAGATTPCARAKALIPALGDGKLA